MFGGIASGLGKIFQGLSSKKTLTQNDILQATEEIKVALIGADVTPSVANKLVLDIKEDLLGKELPQNLSPADAIASIVQQRLMNILGKEFKGIKLNDSFQVILLAGPYGSGKTTTSVKLAKHLSTKHKIKTCVASTDTQRPAAAQQLATFAHSNGVECVKYPEGLTPTKLVEYSIMTAQKQGCNLIILDTAGVDTDQEYTELRKVYTASHASESILVLDSMVGKQSIAIANKFQKFIPCTGVILTKSEGDTRGGVAINIRHETDMQIQYLGTGEDGDAIEEFHPDRISSRLLDRGDIDTIVEKAYEEMGEKKLNSMKGRIVSGKMTFDDYLTQIKSIAKMGGISKAMSFLPGAGQMNDISQIAKNIDFKKQEAIILSMTKKERKCPDLLEKSSSRRVRVSKGSGSTLSDVKKLLNQLQKMQDMAKVMAKMEGNGISMDDLKNFDVNKLKGLMGK